MTQIIPKKKKRGKEKKKPTSQPTKSNAHLPVRKMLRLLKGG